MKMKKWQIENSENSEISEKLFRVFDFALQLKSKTRISKSRNRVFNQAEKIVIIKEELDGIDRDDIGDLEDLLRIVFILEK